MSAVCCLAHLQCLRLPSKQRAAAHGSTVIALSEEFGPSRPQVLHPRPCRRWLALRLLLSQAGGFRTALLFQKR